jgi:hypothetical protein
MKKGVILFHSNIKNIYKERWITKCVDSILNQTDNDFTFYEINYGGDNYSVLNHDIIQSKKFWSIKMINYAYAMNFILDRAFEDGCEVVFNVNLDDYYDLSRFEKQLRVIEEGYDLVSSDFCYVQDNGNDDVITHYMNIKQHGDIEHSLNQKNVNVIAHPAVCYSKHFWNNNRYDPTKAPQEDFDLWKRASANGYQFCICDEILLYHRMHNSRASEQGGNV